MLGYRLFEAYWMCSARRRVDPLTPTKGLWISQRFHKAAVRCLWDILGHSVGLVDICIPTKTEVCVCHTL